MDLSNGLRWVLRPNLGRIPWWVLSRKRRVPGTRVTDHLALLRLRRISERCDGRHLAAQRHAVSAAGRAARHRGAEHAAGRWRWRGCLARSMRETLFRGGSACIPAVPREGLSESLIDPAVAWLRARGCEVVTGRRVAGLRIEAGRVSELRRPRHRSRVEAVVLAVPPWVAADLLPGHDVSKRVPGDPEHPLPR